MEIWRTDPALNVSRLVAFDAESKTLYVGGRDPVSYAFDSATGQLKWQVEHYRTAEVGGQHRHRRYPLLRRDRRNALRPQRADGSIRWTWDSTFEGHGEVFDILRITRYSLLPLLPGTSPFWRSMPAPVWNDGGYRSTKGEYAAAGVVDGNIILGTDIVGEVISVSQMDGRVNWTFAPGSRGFRAPPAIVGDMVYVADKEAHSMRSMR